MGVEVNQIKNAREIKGSMGHLVWMNVWSPEDLIPCPHQKLFLSQGFVFKKQLNIKKVHYPTVFTPNQIDHPSVSIHRSNLSLLRYPKYGFRWINRYAQKHVVDTFFSWDSGETCLYANNEYESLLHYIGEIITDMFIIPDHIIIIKHVTYAHTCFDEDETDLKIRQLCGSSIHHGGAYAAFANPTFLLP